MELPHQKLLRICIYRFEFHWLWPIAMQMKMLPTPKLRQLGLSSLD